MYLLENILGKHLIQYSLKIKFRLITKIILKNKHVANMISDRL